jgi:mRNA interferase RelE/StbE
MDFFRVEWKASTRKDLRKIPADQVGRIVETAGGLGAEPHPAGSQKLQGTERTYRIRVGDYRVVYAVSDSPPTVTVLRVRHRKDVYRG